MFCHRSLAFLLAILCGLNIGQLSTLLCAKKCWVGPVQLGSKEPFLVPCDVVEIDPTISECTATLAIRLMQNEVLGLVDIQPRVTNTSATLKVALDFNIHSTVSMINYTCTSTDHCHEEFVRESIGASGWTQLNVTKTSMEVASLLIDSSFDSKNFTCAHDVQCRSFYENCQADMRHRYKNGHWEQVTFNNNFTCIINHLTEMGMLFDFSTSTNENIIESAVFCNRDQCNDRKTVVKAFDLIMTEYFLPLNYSQFIPSMNTKLYH